MRMIKDEDDKDENDIGWGRKSMRMIKDEDNKGRGK